MLEASCVQLERRICAQWITEVNKQSDSVSSLFTRDFQTRDPPVPVPTLPTSVPEKHSRSFTAFRKWRACHGTLALGACVALHKGSERLRETDHKRHRIFLLTPLGKKPCKQYPTFANRKTKWSDNTSRRKLHAITLMGLTWRCIYSAGGFL